MHPVGREAAFPVSGPITPLGVDGAEQVSAGGRQSVPTSQHVLEVVPLRLSLLLSSPFPQATDSFRGQVEGHPLLFVHSSQLIF